MTATGRPASCDAVTATGRPASRPVRRRLPALLVVGAVLGTAGCQPRPVADQEPLAACGVVVDTTSFGTGTAVADRIDTSVPPFLVRCESVRFGAITGSSQATDCRADALRVEPDGRDNPNGNARVADKFREQHRRDAVRRIKDLLSCGVAEKATRTGSDVLGALDGIFRRTETYGKVTRLLIISDMMERTRSVNLYTADLGSTRARREIIDRIRAEGRLSDMGEVDVRILGFGTFGGSPERVDRVRRFWTELFQRCGVNRVTYL